MLKTTNAIIKNFFILSSSLARSIDLRIEELSLLGRQLYYSQNFSRLAEVGDELINLSPRGEALGRFCKAKSQFGLGQGFDSSIFEDLAGYGPMAIRGAATINLGLQALRSGDLSEARCLLRDSYNLCTESGAALSALHAASSLSLYSSVDGDHKGSLNILRQIQPSVNFWGRYFPHILGEQYNNMAYEAYEIGDLGYAQYAINKAISTPAPRVNPEYYETLKDIQNAAALRPSRSLIIVPVSYEQMRQEAKDLMIRPSEVSDWALKREGAELILDDAEAASPETSFEIDNDQDVINLLLKLGITFDGRIGGRTQSPEPVVIESASDRSNHDNVLDFVAAKRSKYPAYLFIYQTQNGVTQPLWINKFPSDEEVVIWLLFGLEKLSYSKKSNPKKPVIITVYFGMKNSSIPSKYKLIKHNEYRIPATRLSQLLDLISKVEKRQVFVEAREAVIHADLTPEQKESAINFVNRLQRAAEAG